MEPFTQTVLFNATDSTTTWTPPRKLQTWEEDSTSITDADAKNKYRQKFLKNSGLLIWPRNALKKVNPIGVKVVGKDNNSTNVEEVPTGVPLNKLKSKTSKNKKKRKKKKTHKKKEKSSKVRAKMKRETEDATPESQKDLEPKENIKNGLKEPKESIELGSDKIQENKKELVLGPEPKESIKNEIIINKELKEHKITELLMDKEPKENTKNKLILEKELSEINKMEAKSEKG